MEAQSLGADERVSFLDQACANNQRLRAEIESLLAAAHRADDYFDDLAGRLGAANFLKHTDNSELAGIKIGAYQLIRPLGEGGMGSVWLAERIDGRYEGQVAVKLLNAFSGRPSAQRFELEGRYLAKLTHPNIAHLIDAGVLPDQRPYLVLELVEGVRIDTYCDRNGLTIEDRVRLFLKVLDAVAHAHANLIIHRDIKPSNVLVDQEGTVKLLDFGIAKLLTADRPSSLTQEFGTLLTPDYAAPEQLLGGDVTTATDVYTLSLLLYTLVSGQNPRVSTPVSLSTYREDLQKEPPRLSKAVFAAGLTQEDLTNTVRQRRTNLVTFKKELRGDLDNIVRKGMQFDATDRYQTVTGLAADLRRYLRHEPVTAKSDTLIYRFKKFSRRHRGGVAAGVTTALALIGAVVVTSLNMLEAQRQRDIALYEQQRAQANDSLMNLLLSEVSADGGQFTMQDLLDRGVNLLDKRDARGLPMVGEGYLDLSKHYSNLGQQNRVIELREKAAAAARRNEQPDLLARILCSHNMSVYRQDGDKARELASEANAIMRSLQNVSVRTKVECARADANILMLDGELELAKQVLRDAVAYFDETPIALPNNKGALLNHLNFLNFTSGDLIETLAVSAQIQKLLESDGRENSIGYLVVSMNRSAILHSMGEALEALALRESLLETVRSLDESGRSPRGFWSGYAAGLVRLARYDEALEIFHKELKTARENGHKNQEATMQRRIADALSYTPRAGQAEPYLDASEAFVRQTNADPASMESIQVIRTRMLLNSDREEEANLFIGRALTAIGHPENPKKGLHYRGLLTVAAQAAFANQQTQRCIELASDALYEARSGARDPEASEFVGHALLIRGKAYLEANRKKEAVVDLRNAVKPLTIGIGADHPKTREVQALLAQLN